MRLAALLLVGALAASAQGVSGSRPAPKAPPKPGITSGETRDLKYPPLHSVRNPELTGFTLPNGLKLYLSEDHELPVIGGAVLVRAGSAYDPPDRIGLASIAGYLVRSGGTSSKTGEAVDQALKTLGMTMDSDVRETATIFNFSGLGRNAEPTLALLRELVTQPEFRQDRLAQGRLMLRERIAHRNDDLDRLAMRELTGAIFGKDSPYGWRLDYAGIDRITRSELLKYHKRYFFPANMTVGIRGDFDAARMRGMVEQVFGVWTSAQEPVPAAPPTKTTPAGGIYLGEKKDAPETHVVVGQASGLIAAKDAPALEVMGQAFNQLQKRISERANSLDPASTRLMTVRVDNVKASWGAGYDRAGMFRIAATCRGASTPDVVFAIQQDIEQMRNREISDEDLRAARDATTSALASNFDTARGAFERTMLDEFYGMPRNFAQQYQASVAAVTRADILRVAKQYLDPAAIAYVVIANPQVFASSLEKVNPQIKRLDLTIPEPVTIRSETTDASLSEGKKILQRAQTAVGGVERLESVKSYTLVTDFQVDPGVAGLGGAKVVQMDRWISPGTFRQDLSQPRISIYSDGKNSWIANSQGWGALAGAQRKQFESDLFRSYFRLLLSDRIEGRTVNKVDEDLIEISDKDGQLARLEFDPKTGLPRRCTYDIPQSSGPPLFAEEAYSDFRDVNGIQFPYKTVIMQSGKKFADVAVTELTMNPPLRALELALRPQ